MRKSAITATVAAFSLCAIAGCTVYVRPAPAYVAEPPPPPPPPPGPVIVDPSVVVIDFEPDPIYRVYVYDPGYPPGCYFYGGFYYYGGYRYPHDIFINRYVTVNIRENRYIDVNANRRAGVRIETQHREEFARTRGAPPRPAGHPAEHERHEEH